MRNSPEATSPYGEGGHSHGQELKRNYKDKQYQNKTKLNNADEVNVMIKIK